MYTDDKDEEEKVIEVMEKIVITKSSEHVVTISSLHEDTFKRERKLSRQFSDDFIDMFKGGESNNVCESTEVLEKSNEDEKQDSSETSSTSENIYEVNPEMRVVTRDEELVRPARPGLNHLVPSLAKDCREEEEEEEDLFLSAEDLLVQALCLGGGSKKIIGEDEDGGEEERISKYRVCERISEASEESSLELVPPENEPKDLLVFSDIFSSVPAPEKTGVIGDDESRKESTSSILPDIRDIQSQIGDIREEKEEKRGVKEIDLLDEDTMTSVEINQLFDDELKQVGEIKQGLSELSHTLVGEQEEQEKIQKEQEQQEKIQKEQEQQEKIEKEQEQQERVVGEKVVEGRSLRHLLCSLGRRSGSLEEVLPGKDLLLRRTTSEPLLELIDESEEEKIGLKNDEMNDDHEGNKEQSNKDKRNNNQNLQHQHDGSEMKSSEEEKEEEDKEEEEEEDIRPILKKRTRLSVSESGSQTEISALDERRERHQVGHCINYFFFAFECKISQSTSVLLQDERYQSAPMLSEMDIKADGGPTIRRSHSVSFALPTRWETFALPQKSVI